MSNIKTNTIVYLFFVFFCLLVACGKATNEDKYVIVVNNRNCLTCEQGTIARFSDDYFHRLLIEKSIKVVFPKMREVEQKNTIKIYNLDSVNVVFDDKLYEEYQNKIKSPQTSIIKILNDSVIRSENLGLFDYHKTDFFSE